MCFTGLKEGMRALTAFRQVRCVCVGGDACQRRAEGMGKNGTRRSRLQAGAQRGVCGATGHAAALVRCAGRGARPAQPRGRGSQARLCWSEGGSEGRRVRACALPVQATDQAVVSAALKAQLRDQASALLKKVIEAQKAAAAANKVRLVGGRGKLGRLGLGGAGGRACVFGAGPSLCSATCSRWGRWAAPCFAWRCC